MPHQCLGCGQSFAEGSSELLRGCPGCQGTRFFYTPAPLDAKGLAAKRGEAEHDLRAIAETMKDDPDLWTWKKRDAWVRFDSGKVDDTLTRFSEERARSAGRGKLIVAPSGEIPTVAEFVGGKLARDAATRPAPAAKPEPAAEETAAAAPAPAPAEAAPPAPATEEGPRPVASVRVDRPGTYDIDVKGLLEANPVVIERDGVYMIHLPSVFETNERRK